MKFGCCGGPFHLFETANINNFSLPFIGVEVLRVGHWGMEEGLGGVGYPREIELRFIQELEDWILGTEEEDSHPWQRSPF
jgi:hypothetical protein